MPKYDHKKIEAKWKKSWEKSKIYKTNESSDKPKYYVLDMFPYPSGAGLHVGHPKGYIATDIVARMKMMQGYNVLHPMGWDAFGLPAENYALKNKVHPAEATAENIKVFKKQLGLLGFTYDWDREVNTTDPEYYKWTQWIFLQLFKKGLAFESYEPINWCPGCKTGLANEDLEDGKCERCGSVVEQKPMRQWVLKITNYAERLLNDIELLKEWPEPIKEMQRNWIGKSEGAIVKFKIKDSEQIFEVFTTRPDTLFGATYCVVAPENKMVDELRLKINNIDEVGAYLAQAKKKTTLERTELQKEKTGVELKGIKAVNPANGEELPIFVADYVLGGYGTGAIMAVPAHDERDFEFAKKYNLAIKEVVKSNIPAEGCFTGDGVSINSDFLNDLSTPEAKEKMIEWLEEKGLGQRKIQYKLRDWVFSRQRYWGEPMPLVHCDRCAQRKPKVVLVHGLNGHAQENWFPWLKEQLEKRGYEVLIPNLPNAEKPKLTEWVEALKKLDIKDGDKVFVVGHSLGCPVVCKFVEEKNIAVEKIILVAPTGKHQNEANWKNLFDACGSNEALECIRKFNSEELNWSKIKALVEKRLIYFSDNDPFISLEVENDYKNLDPIVTKFNARGHFNRKVGLLSFPEIEREFPEVSKLNVGWHAIPEKDLPVELPKVKHYEPTGTGESPLAGIDKWVNTKCPHCGGPAKRETNTMPQWAGSCWYYLAYAMKVGNKFEWDKEKVNYWNPVDLYVGGAEHATRHLIYARFWHKFLFDIGAVNSVEPFTKLQNLGVILAEDGRKMSKRWNNVINPDDVVAEFGADSMRLYEMFMGPFDQACAWSTKGVIGCRRFLEKVWTMSEKIEDERLKISDDNTKLEILLNQTIKKVTEDIMAMRFNTAISQLMIFANETSQSSVINFQSFGSFLQLLAPFAPHLSEELWSALGNKDSIFKSAWPKFDSTKIQHSEITIVIQVNGKVRDEMIASADISEADAKAKALASEKIQKWLEGKEPKKVIYVKGKLVSIVV